MTTVHQPSADAVAASAAYPCFSCGHDRAGAGVAPDVPCPACGWLPQEPAPEAGDAPPPGGSLTAATAHGVLWFTLQSLLFKGVSTFAQIALAWILQPQAFGVIMLATTVSVLATLIQSAGIGAVLVQRGAHFHRWANAAFWMSLCLGVGASLLMLAAAPLAARAYQEPALVPVVAVLALVPPLTALQTVPLARLQVRLRFRLIATTLGAVNSAQVLAYVVLAWAGLEAQAFAVSRVLGAGALALLLWRSAGYRPRRRPEIHGWRYMLADSALLLGTSVCYTLISQGDAMLLGVLEATPIVGVYYFAFNLSLQTLQLVTGSFESILFPALSRLQDDRARQTAAFLRAESVLVALTMPLCLLQAALAEPVLRLLFGTRWLDAVAPLQVLSIGMVFLALAMPTGSLVQAQGRFRTRLALAIVSLALYFPLVYGAWRLGTRAGWHPAAAIAAGVACYHAVTGTLALAVAIVPGRSSRAVARDLARTIVLPGIAAALSVLAGAVAGGAVRARLGDGFAACAAHVAVVGLVAAPVYLALVRVLMPGAWHEIGARLAPIGHRLRRRTEPEGTPGPRA